MTIVLGVNYSHDSSAALAIDGEIISAIEEERLNGIKHTRVFPTNAIAKCLDMSGLSVSDIDILATPLESPQYKTYEVIEKIKDEIGYDGYVQFHQHHLCQRDPNLLNHLYMYQNYYPNHHHQSHLNLQDQVANHH